MLFFEGDVMPKGVRVISQTPPASRDDLWPKHHRRRRRVLRLATPSVLIVFDLLDRSLCENAALRLVPS
jgi:hypothetical protein